MRAHDTKPSFGLDKIKFATDRPTFEKAVDLYEKRKVKQFKYGIRSYAAVVQGTKPYRVSVEARQYDIAHCECYLGESGTLCKHMVAVAIYAAKGGLPLTEEDKRLVSEPACSGKRGELSKVELSTARKAITDAMRHIKPYDGPSHTWFFYQNSLSEGANRLSKIVSELPVSEQTATLLIDMLLRLDERLSRGGVDDSDGTVGNFIIETVDVLKEYGVLDSACANAFQILKNRRTSFDWEEPLLEFINKK